MNVLVFGAGYSGRRFAEMRPGGVAIAGTTRTREKFGMLRGAGIEPFVFSGQPIENGLQQVMEEATHLVVSIAPDDAGDPILAALASLPGAMPKLRWIGYLSTVGVYGDYGGMWVHEGSRCKPVSNRSRLRVDAEKAWLDFAASRGLPAAILRLSGIYGPGRNAFVNLHNGTAKRLIKPGQVFNRIHVDDIAGSIWHLVASGTGGIFNVTDDEPAPPQDVVTYAAQLMSVEPPPEIPFASAQLSPMARSFYGESKRVSNALLKAEGYSFRYPDYRAALSAMWREGNWRGSDRSDARSPIRP
ncbi:MAG: SDR family oxidoreductase [Rhizobiaceae bacterium]|nr:SDR family oxidoreductase [Rhizobiaceae bacterium]